MIGVFDSGFGGLTVLDALIAALARVRLPVSRRQRARPLRRAQPGRDLRVHARGGRVPVRRRLPAGDPGLQHGVRARAAHAAAAPPAGAPPGPPHPGRGAPVGGGAGGPAARRAAGHDRAANRRRALSRCWERPGPSLRIRTASSSRSWRRTYAWFSRPVRSGCRWSRRASSPARAPTTSCTSTWTRSWRRRRARTHPARLHALSAAATGDPRVVDGLGDPRVEILDQGEIVASRLAQWLARHPEMTPRLTQNGARRYATTDDPRVVRGARSGAARTGDCGREGAPASRLVQRPRVHARASAEIVSPEDVSTFLEELKQVILTLTGPGPMTRCAAAGMCRSRASASALVDIEMLVLADDHAVEQAAEPWAPRSRQAHARRGARRRSIEGSQGRRARSDSSSTSGD